MIGLLLAALLQAPPAPAAVPPGRRPGDWCRGIHMPNGAGGVNLLWTTIAGPADRLEPIAARMTALGATVASEGETLGPGEIRAHYRDDLDVRAMIWGEAAFSPRRPWTPEEIVRLKPRADDWRRRAAIFGKTAQERRAMGLPDEDWEDEVWEGFDLSPPTAP